MSDNIPIEIQLEIIKKVSDVRSLVRFRSVSKPWKSFIDSSEFIQSYGARHTQLEVLLNLGNHVQSYVITDKIRYICWVDDDDNNETFKVQRQQQSAPFVLSPLLKQYNVYEVIGACHGLLCFRGFHKGYNKEMLVIWNPSIGKSFGVVDPLYDNHTYCFFGVCPVTKDPTVVKMGHYIGMPWHVQVFTLSSGVWNVIPSANLPRQSIQLDPVPDVVIDRLIYWVACEKISTDNGAYITNRMLVSFDLITKEFKLIYLPDSLTNKLIYEIDEEPVSIAKRRDSLVVYGPTEVMGKERCGVWVMEHDSSFRMLFTIRASVYNILGFRKSGEIIFEYGSRPWDHTFVYVYNPSSKQINHLTIDGHDVEYSFFMGSYMESLILLDHSDSHIYT